MNKDKEKKTFLTKLFLPVRINHILCVSKKHHENMPFSTLANIQGAIKKNLPRPKSLFHMLENPMKSKM